MQRSKTILWILAAIAAIAIVAVMVVVYRDHNPMESNLFPKCSFYVLTGYQCPGCGGQRAVHYLLNGHLKESFLRHLLFLPKYQKHY